MATTASAISSEAIGPMMCTPRMRSVARVGDKFHEAAGVAERARTAVGHERETARRGTRTPSLFNCCSVLPTHAISGRSVDHPGYGVEVDVAVLARDALRDRDAFLFRLVREHGAAHDVADRPDVRQVGAALVVDRDEAARVELEPDRLPRSSPAVFGTRPIATISLSQVAASARRPALVAYSTVTPFCRRPHLGDLAPSTILSPCSS